MEQVIYTCKTDGCQSQGQATGSRWCQACGLPNDPDPSPAAAIPVQPSRPVAPATPSAPAPVSLSGRGSGTVAFAVVVALTAVVLFATHSLLGIGTGGSPADASVVATGPSPDAQAPEQPAETSADSSTVDSSTQDTSSTEGTAATEEPATTDTIATGPATELAGGASASASATAPDSKDDSGSTVSYEAANVLDGDPATAWRVKGDGQDVTLTLTLPGPAHITEVGLVPGYAKTDPTSGKDRFVEDHRISEVRWQFDDGTVTDQQLADEPTMQRQAVNVTSTTVTIEIVATLPGQPGFDYTPVSDVSIMGTQ